MEYRTIIYRTYVVFDRLTYLATIILLSCGDRSQVPSAPVRRPTHNELIVCFAWPTNDILGANEAKCVTKLTRANNHCSDQGRPNSSAL
jgi:hypothetical protein